jgi:hypothetical protein
VCARRITELECTLKSERTGIRRQMILKQIWRLRTWQEQESATSDELDEQPTCSLSPLSTQIEEGSRVAVAML